MIRFQRITTADTAPYAFMEKLLQTSFPAEEYRDLQALRNYTDNNPLFSNHVIWDDETMIGLITWWDFDTFCYAEHLAIDPSLRNGGYGSRTIRLLTETVKKPLILEVEMPDTDEARRRIGFYQRQGFRLWDEVSYLQPPYRPGDSFLPMYLMGYGEIGPKDADRVKDRIYREVYGQQP